MAFFVGFCLLRWHDESSVYEIELARLCKRACLTELPFVLVLLLIFSRLLLHRNLAGPGDLLQMCIVYRSLFQERRDV